MQQETCSDAEETGLLITRFKRRIQITPTTPRPSGKETQVEGINCIGSCTHQGRVPSFCSLSLVSKKTKTLAAVSVKTQKSYATMCNMPHREGRRPYGRDALAPSEHDYPIHEAGPEYDSHNEPLRFVPNYETEESPYDTFEGLRADECGILNGCENGRCIRVPEGYTCDCFDGYTLDMSRMACTGEGGGGWGGP
ncbi:hypothetical protein JZ751_011275 [Albula glossodonta]|uniref:EGF-like domain-containing protein n=1 Tax=Albula glossodonta TaxID=121402 RepID=A0A8T2NUH5_9TELE|nr:hypothetical protein JZ751_011275 [Albula glossodonta]